MKTVGIFEAKTHFTALCEEVSRTGQPTVVSKRGRPIVVVSPVSPVDNNGREGILSDWQNWEKIHPPGDEGQDFPDVSQLRGNPKPNPLED
jgi:prevent-host-death family protein